jgi:hypothetical protein
MPSRDIALDEQSPTEFERSWGPEPTGPPVELFEFQPGEGGPVPSLK